MSLRIGLGFAIIFAAAANVLPAQPSAAPPAVLVELFTSEGCSSCPPADALLRKLDGMRSEKGQLIVGISEHVTYWNSLGWADPFSSDALTQRQNAYANRFQLDSVYTPQIVVNGERQLVGSDGSGVLRAILAEDRTSPVRIEILSAVAAGENIAVTVSVSGTIPSSGVELYAAVADDTRTSKVGRGENSGRTLTHVSVARSLTRLAKVKTAGIMTVSVPGRPAETGVGRHVVVFAQTPGLGRVVGVETKAL